MLVPLLLAPAVVPNDQTFACTPSLVWDGDGPIWRREGAHVRLAGIAAREIDNSCRPGQPCPRASGPAARDALVRLLGGPRGRTSTGPIRVAGSTLRCVSIGAAKGNPTGTRSNAPGLGHPSFAYHAPGTGPSWRKSARSREGTGVR